MHSMSLKALLDNCESNDPQQKRNHILSLILDTEKNYETHLFRLKQEYITPMKQSGILTPTEFQILFPNELNIISSLNTQVLRGLEMSINEELSGETPNTTVGQIFIQFVSFVQTYVDYTNLYDKMITFMRNKKAQNKKFKDLLDMLQRKCKSTVDGCSLNGYLIQPIHRIPNYCTMLEALLQNTDEEYFDWEHLSGALEPLRPVASWVNERIVQLENQQRLADLQRNIRNPNPKEFKVPLIVKPDRVLVREGPLTLVPNDFMVDGLDPEGRLGGEMEVYGYLFSDMFLVCRKLLASSVQRGLSVKKKSEDEEPLDFYLFHMFLYKLPVVWAIDCRLLNIFQVVGKRTYTMRSESAQLTNEWVEEIRSVMNSIKEQPQSKVRGHPYAVSEVEHPIIENQMIVFVQAALRGFKQRKRREFREMRRKTRIERGQKSMTTYIHLLNEGKVDLTRNQMIEDRNIERRKTIINEERAIRRATILQSRAPVMKASFIRRESIVSGKSFRRQMPSKDQSRDIPQRIEMTATSALGEIDVTELITVAEEYAIYHESEVEDDREKYYKNMPIAVVRSPTVFRPAMFGKRRFSLSDDAVVVEAADDNEPEWFEHAPSIEYLHEEYYGMQTDLSKVCDYESVFVPVKKRPSTIDLRAYNEDQGEMITFINPLYEHDTEEEKVDKNDEEEKNIEKVEEKPALEEDVIETEDSLTEVSDLSDDESEVNIKASAKTKTTKVVSKQSQVEENTKEEILTPHSSQDKEAGIELPADIKPQEDLVVSTSVAPPSIPAEKPEATDESAVTLPETEQAIAKSHETELSETVPETIIENPEPAIESTPVKSADTVVEQIETVTAAVAELKLEPKPSEEPIPTESIIKVDPPTTTPEITEEQKPSEVISSDIPVSLPISEPEPTKPVQQEQTKVVLPSKKKVFIRSGRSTTNVGGPIINRAAPSPSVIVAKAQPLQPENVVEKEVQNKEELEKQARQARELEELQQKQKEEEAEKHRVEQEERERIQREEQMEKERKEREEAARIEQQKQKEQQEQLKRQQEEQLKLKQQNDDNLRSKQGLDKTRSVSVVKRTGSIIVRRNTAAPTVQSARQAQSANKDDPTNH